MVLVDVVKVVNAITLWRSVLSRSFDKVAADEVSGIITVISRGRGRSQAVSQPGGGLLIEFPGVQRPLPTSPFRSDWSLCVHASRWKGGDWRGGG